MGSLSIVESKLPPGFRFHPRDDELICDFLMNWVMGFGHTVPLIQVDLNKCEPWEIPGIACVGGKEWYFYNQRDRKYATGYRTNRATVSGYWKATGKDRAIFRKENLVGMRKTLVFYEGRAPKGRKTDWVMHEFRLEGSVMPDPKVATSSDKEDWVLCRVFSKSKIGVSGKQQPLTTSRGGMSPSPPRLPPLIESYAPVDHLNPAAGITHPYQEQVPCFSIFTQTNHSSSFISSFDIPRSHFIPHLGTYDDYMINNNPASCNEERIKGVWSHIRKTETCVDEQQGINGSPSFGEGSSDSYLSEVGLSSMWNQYS